MGIDRSWDDLDAFIKGISQNPEEDKEKRYQFLMSAEDGLEELHPTNYMNLTGYLIDISFDLDESAGLERAINLCEQLLERDLSPSTRSRLHYQMANAQSHLGDLDSQTESNNWDNQYLENEVVYLRKGLSEEGVERLSDEIQCKMYTNLGNALSRAGRVIEAFEWWNRSLNVDSSHAMAIGNRGAGKKKYAMAIYDRGHFAVFLASALRDLNKAVTSNQIHPNQRQGFQAAKEGIEEVVGGDVDEILKDLESYSLGDSEKEIRYSKWCLRNRLFLNPLNDITDKPIAGQDVLHLPDMTFEKPFPYPGLYNQMKQEFVSARYLFYTGLVAEEPHFSDEEVYLDNTLDYPVYSLATEKMKAGLRMSYSIFDKIAFFLNEYLNLGESEDSFSFSNIWFENLRYDDGLRSIFTRMDNWPLQALYWLRKDFYGGKFNTNNSFELIADDLSEIRHHLEHKYLKVHDDAIVGDISEEQPTGVYEDTLKFSISRANLEEAALRMLKTSRAALIYLSLGVHIEEKSQEKNQDDTPVLPIHSVPFEDDRKR